MTPEERAIAEGSAAEATATQLSSTHSTSKKIRTPSQMEDEVERCSYNWVLLNFKEIFQLLERKQSTHVNRSAGDRQPDISNVEYLSDTFIRGQLVGRTSVWQVELRRNGAFVSVGLTCVECLQEGVNEVWTRFDSYIVDFNGKICHSAGGSHFDNDNITKFTPQDKIGNKKDAKVHGLCSFWEMDLITMKDLQEHWNTLLPRNILSLRLKLTIYKDKPFCEAGHLAEFHEPVRLCYTDNSQLSLFVSSPLLQAMRNLWETRENADITFLVEGNNVKAHKLIVTLLSPILKSMVNDAKEGAVIEVSNVSHSTFVPILKYLYTQDAEELKASTDIDYIARVLDAANQLEIASLSRICLARLLTNISVENFGETALAIYRRVPKLEGSHFRTEVKRFLMENQHALRRSQEFKVHSKNNKDEFLQLCFESIKVMRSNSIRT